MIRQQIGVNSVQSHVTTADEHETLVLFDQQWRCNIVLLFNANNEKLLFICLQHRARATWGEGAREGQFILLESLETWNFGCDCASGFVGSRIVNILIWEKRSAWSIADAFILWNIFLVKYLYFSFQRNLAFDDLLKFLQVHLLRFSIVCHV